MSNIVAIPNDGSRGHGPTLDLGFEFHLYLHQFCDAAPGATAQYTIAQLIAALEATTTLRELVILNFVLYHPTPANNRRVIEPLCQCLANLRRQNSDHPLFKLTLCVCGEIMDETMWNALQQFLVAAQQGGICHIKIATVRYLPVELLVDYCRDFKNLTSLDLWDVSFLGVRSKRDENSRDSPSVTLDKLALRDICFESSRAATVFENFVEDLTVASLELGKLTIREGDEDTDHDEDDLDDNAYDYYDFEDDDEKEEEDDNSKGRKQGMKSRRKLGKHKDHDLDGCKDKEDTTDNDSRDGKVDRVDDNHDDTPATTGLELRGKVTDRDQDSGNDADANDNVSGESSGDGKVTADDPGDEKGVNDLVYEIDHGNDTDLTDLKQGKVADRDPDDPGDEKNVDDFAYESENGDDTEPTGLEQGIVADRHPHSSGDNEEDDIDDDTAIAGLVQSKVTIRDHDIPSDDDNGDEDEIVMEVEDDHKDEDEVEVEDEDTDDYASEGFGYSDFDEDDCDNECTGRIVTKLIKPSVEQLSLTRLCRKKHFQAALDAGQASVINLWVAVQRDNPAKLKMLGSMIRGAVQLNNLTLRNLGRRPWLQPKPRFFRDFAACATIKRIQLVRFHSKAVTRLQGIVTRNCELARFVASPISYPTDAMLSLVSQFPKCPTGLYMLARGLPGVISFDKTKSKTSPTEPKQKKQKVA